MVHPPRNSKVVSEVMKVVNKKSNKISYLSHKNLNLKPVKIVTLSIVYTILMLKIIITSRKILETRISITQVVWSRALVAFLQKVKDQILKHLAISVRKRTLATVNKLAQVKSCQKKDRLCKEMVLKPVI